MSLIPSISSLRESMVNMSRRFPAACCFAIALSIALIIMVIVEEYRGVPIYYCTAAFLLSLMLALWNEEYHNKRMVWTVTAIAHILLLIDAIYLWNLDLSRFSAVLYIARAAVYAAFALGILFLSFYKEKNDVKSWNFTFRMIVALVLSFIIGGVMTGGIEGLLSGIQSLFNIKIDSKVYLIVSILFGQLLPMLLFLSRVPSGERKHDDTIIASRFLTGTTRYLFIPLVTCYMLVLYGYLARILFSWELPKGTISWLVTAMMFGIIAVEFLLYPSMRSQESKTFERWVVRWFPILALPLVILMTVGIARRFGDYGITVNRLYVLTLNLWFYAVCIGLFILKARRIHWIPLSFGAILLLTSAQPMNYCEIVKLHFKQKMAETIAQYQPEHLPMNRDEFSTWVNSLPEDVSDQVYDQLNYLNDFYKGQTAQWISDDVPLWRSSRNNNVETFFYETTANHITIPEGYHRLVTNGEYDILSSTDNQNDSILIAASKTSLNDSILLLHTTGINNEDLFFEVNLEEFRRKKAQGIRPIYYTEKERGDSVLLYFERLRISHDYDGTCYVDSRVNVFFK